MGGMISITADDVGRRVLLRRRLPNGYLTDAIGELESWSGGVLVVHTKDGSHVEVAEETLVAGKVVPPPPPRRARRGTSM